MHECKYGERGVSFLVIYVSNFRYTVKTSKSKKGRKFFLLLEIAPQKTPIPSLENMHIAQP
jgi:hypothetical protein